MLQISWSSFKTGSYGVIWKIKGKTIWSFRMNSRNLFTLVVWVFDLELKWMWHYRVNGFDSSWIKREHYREGSLLRNLGWMKGDGLTVWFWDPMGKTHGKRLGQVRRSFRTILGGRRVGEIELDFERISGWMVVCPKFNFPKFLLLLIIDG